METPSLLRILLAAAIALAPAVTGCAGAGRAAVEADGALHSGLETLVQEELPAEVAVACRDLASGHEWLVRADEVFHAASTMKVAVLVELYRQAEAGRFALDEPLTLVNEFASIVDGSPYALDPAEDEDPGLYAELGRGVTSRELARRMIVRSSNLATNTLITRVGAREIEATLRALGIERMRVLRGVEDSKAYDAGLNNVTTARDLMRLLAAIAEERAASPASCRAMIATLSGQEFHDMLPQGLPPGTKIAHKTGSITGIRHDAGIVFPAGRPPYVLVVLTRGFEDPERAARAGAEVARLVHARLVSR